MFQVKKNLPKWRQLFVKRLKRPFFFAIKGRNLVQFRSYDFVQMSLACCSNFVKECMERLQTVNSSISNSSTEELNSGSLTRITRLLVALHIADPISLKEKIKGVLHHRQFRDCIFLKNYNTLAGWQVKYVIL